MPQLDLNSFAMLFFSTAVTYLLLIYTTENFTLPQVIFNALPIIDYSYVRLNLTLLMGSTFLRPLRTFTFAYYTQRL
jgi:hypothetical protein